MAASPSLRTRLRGRQVGLRPPRRGDAAPLCALLTANVEHLAPWFPASPLTSGSATPADVQVEVTRWRRAWRADDSYLLLMEARSRPTGLAGWVALNRVQRGPWQSAWLGYWIDRDRQGQGMTTEAVDLALDFAFGALGLHRVQAAVLPRNPASARVLSKAGFRREGLSRRYLQIAGRWEDHELYALTREERSPEAGLLER